MGFAAESMPRLETDMKKRIMLQITLLVAGLILMGAGVLRSELTDIFRKGTVICMECIGIG